MSVEPALEIWWKTAEMPEFRKNAMTELVEQGEGVEQIIDTPTSFGFIVERNLKVFLHRQLGNDRPGRGGPPAARPGRAQVDPLLRRELPGVARLEVALTADHRSVIA